MLVKTPADIGRLIRGARTAAGLTQSQLASRCDTNQAWISLVENGKDTVEIGTVMKVLSVLRLSLDATETGTPVSDAAAGFADDFPDIDSIVDGGPEMKG